MNKSVLGIIIVLGVCPKIGHSQTGPNNPSNPNAGGYNGNYSGSTHNGTGVAGGSRAGATSTGPNNPSNPNAGGYHGNLSGSTHAGSGVAGGSRAGATSSSGSSGSNRSVQNNPGMAGAGGYTGDFTGSTHNGTGVAGGSRAGATTHSVSFSNGKGFDPANNTEMGSSVDRTAQRSAISDANRAATAAGKKANSMEWTKAYYGGLVKSYTKAKVDPHMQNLPSGPMNAITRMSNKANPTFRSWAPRTDEAYRSVKTFDISMPYELAKNKKYAQTPLQEFGLQMSIVVRGPLAELQKIGFELNEGWLATTYTAAFNDVTPGGMIGAANDSRFADRMDQNIAHEAVHAAVQAVAYESRNNLAGVPTSVAEAAFDAASSMQNHGFYSKTYDPAFGVGVPKNLLGTYMNQEEEITAYTITNDLKNLQNMMVTRGIKPAQAAKIASKISKSKGLKNAVKAMESYVARRK